MASKCKWIWKNKHCTVLNCHDLYTVMLKIKTLLGYMVYFFVLLGMSHCEFLLHVADMQSIILS